MQSATTTLLTIAGTLGAAFFTSVLAHYLFTPWLEARKEDMIERYKQQVEFAQKLGGLALGSLYQENIPYSKAASRMRHPSTFAGVRSKDVQLFVSVIFLAGFRNQLKAKSGGEVELVHDILSLAASLAQPYKTPWLRPWRRFRLKRLLNRARKNGLYVEDEYLDDE